MAHLNLEEQEQIAKIKYFLRDYGKYIIGLIVVMAVMYGISEIRSYKNEKNTTEAAIIYAKLSLNNTTANPTVDKNIIYNATDELESKYSTTQYATFASLFAAKIAFDDTNFTKAMNYLQWVILHAKDKSLVAIAKLRLADVYIDTNKLQDAIKITMDKVDDSFKPLFYQKRGDVYLVMNNKQKAIESYKSALELSRDNQDLAQLIQIKLDILNN